MTDSGPPRSKGGLHTERTALAWRRLALVLLGMAVISARLLWPRFDAWALLPTIAIAGVAALLLVQGQRRHLAPLHGSTSTPPDGRLALFAAAATTGTAVLWLVAVASGR